MKLQNFRPIVLILLTSFVTVTAALSANKPNVLLIIADDLNNWIGPSTWTLSSRPFAN